jgi:hypothetical protein
MSLGGFYEFSTMLTRFYFFLIVCILVIPQSIAAKCADSVFISKCLEIRNYAYPSPYLKIRYYDSLGEVHSSVTTNETLFRHLWEQHGLNYDKYKPYMEHVLLSDSVIPFEKIRGLNLVAVKGHPVVDSIARLGRSAVLKYFFSAGAFKKRNVASIEEAAKLPTFYDVVSALFDLGVLLESIEEMNVSIFLSSECTGL